MLFLSIFRILLLYIIYYYYCIINKKNNNIDRLLKKFLYSIKIFIIEN